MWYPDSWISGYFPNTSLFGRTPTNYTKKLIYPSIRILHNLRYPNIQVSRYWIVKIVSISKYPDTWVFPWIGNHARFLSEAVSILNSFLFPPECFSSQGKLDCRLSPVLYPLQARWNSQKVGWDISIWWAQSAPDWNRVKIAPKRWLGRIPTVPLRSAGPALATLQTHVIVLALYIYI